MSARRPRHAVLHHAQRADDRAVDAAEKQRGDDERRYDADVHGQQGRQELDARQPAEPCVECAGEVEKEQRDEREADDGRCDSEFA